LLERSLIQERNNITDNKADLKTVTTTSPSEQEIEDLIFALKFVKHKIKHDCLQKNGTLIASGTGKHLELMLSASRKSKSFDLIYMALQWQVIFFLFQIVYIGKRSWHYSSNTTRRIH
jgi:hypothetical protein